MTNKEQAVLDAAVVWEEAYQRSTWESNYPNERRQLACAVSEYLAEKDLCPECGYEYCSECRTHGGCHLSSCSTNAQPEIEEIHLSFDCNSPDSIGATFCKIGNKLNKVIRKVNKMEGGK